MIRNVPHPPFDPELAAALGALGEKLPPTVTAGMISQMREVSFSPPPEQLFAGRDIEWFDVTIPGFDGADITVTVFRRRGRIGPGPGIYHTHGGGMVLGDRFGISMFADWIERHDAVLVSVEYRLAPEFPDPYPVEDCYAGLMWTADNALELGIDPAKLLIAGASAGGGLAAGTALLARDRQGPPLIGQVLDSPMIDDRDQTLSTSQVDGIGVWDRGSNITGWTALLGSRRGGEDVSIYAAPARAQDLTGLPPAFIGCGSVEVFRDEDISYAQKLWACGGSAELHVWSGGFHGFEMVPQAAISQASRTARDSWVARLLGD